MTISKGNVCAWSSSNDGLDANGNLTIDSGVVLAIGSNSPEVAIDANTEGGKKFTFNGGTLVAIGGIENGSTLNQSCYSASQTRDTWFALYSGSEAVLAFKTPSTVGSNGTIIVSTSGTTSLKKGITTSGGSSLFGGIALTGASVSDGTQVSLSNYTGGSGMGPGGPRW